MRHKLEVAASKGMLANSAMIAHGRGEAYDYLLGEQTIPSAFIATKEIAARLLNADNPIISLNGNAIALAGEGFLKIAALLNCPIEINIFYRTPERMNALLSHLNGLNEKLGLNVTILGGKPDAKITGLEGPRSNCHKNGIFDSDVILVPLEDGDRCEALVNMGKDVLVIDLNPLSRSAKMASVTVVDELSRVVSNLLEIIPSSPVISDWDNDECLQSALTRIVETISKPTK
jgi:4-phosphopantoate--beta-alanine ligase